MGPGLVYSLPNWVRAATEELSTLLLLSTANNIKWYWVGEGGAKADYMWELLWVLKWVN